MQQLLAENYVNRKNLVINTEKVNLHSNEIIWSLSLTDKISKREGRLHFRNVNNNSQNKNVSKDIQKFLLRKDTNI